jgi:hypothetical protein
VSEDALYRHVTNGHILTVVKAQDTEQRLQQALDINDCAKEIYDIAIAATHEARQAGQFSAVGSCLKAASNALCILKPTGKEDPPEPKESGFMKGYLARAEEVYAKDQSPPS